LPKNPFDKNEGRKWRVHALLSTGRKGGHSLHKHSNSNSLQIFVGASALQEAQLIGLGLKPIASRQRDDLDRAKSYAREQSIKHGIAKQQLAYQANVSYLKLLHRTPILPSNSLCCLF
jgi:hypothetical protein